MLLFGPIAVPVEQVSRMRAGGSGTNVPSGSCRSGCQSANWSSTVPVVMAWDPEPSAFMTANVDCVPPADPVWYTIWWSSPDHLGQSAVLVGLMRVGFEPSIPTTRMPFELKTTFVPSGETLGAPAPIDEPIGMRPVPSAFITQSW